jgi:hypothetical protein
MTLEETLQLMAKYRVTKLAIPINDGGIQREHVIEMVHESPVMSVKDQAEQLRSMLGAEIEEKCKCGHPFFAHMNGLCVNGCSVEQCAPEATQAERFGKPDMTT